MKNNLDDYKKRIITLKKTDYEFEKNTSKLFKRW